MVRRRITINLGVLAALIGGGYSFSDARAADEGLPIDLMNIAQSLGCDSVNYERDGRIDPSYLYGYRPDDRNNSAAFWCFQALTHKYLLVFVRKGKLEAFGGCPPTLSLPGGFPGGLSLWKEQRLPLWKFYFLDRPSEHGPRGQFTQYAPILEEYDGVGSFIYCHKGRWLVWPQD